MKDGKRITLRGDTYAIVHEYGDCVLKDPKYAQTASFRHHYTSNAQEHMERVTIQAVRLAKWLHIKVDASSLIRGCLLHDYYLYEYTTTHTKGHIRHHGETASHLAERDFGINDIERNIIERHMWPMRLTWMPKCREAWLCSISDKIVAIAEMLNLAKKPKL